MTKLIPPPPPTVPIGRVDSKGNVIISQDWALYLTFGLLQRIGGYNAPDLQEVNQRISQYFHGGGMDDGAGEDVIFVPGPQGQQGVPGREAVMSLDFEDGGGETIFVPGSQGPQGPAGPAGIFQFWEADAPTEPIFPPNQPPVWGRYTPTLTNVANLDASTAYECRYVQIGGMVIVSGKVDVNPTAAVATQLGISLPFPSTFSSTSQVSGAAASSNSAGQSAAIIADTANGRAEMNFIAVDLNNRAMYFNFMYQVN